MLDCTAEPHYFKHSRIKWTQHIYFEIFFRHSQFLDSHSFPPDDMKRHFQSLFPSHPQTVNLSQEISFCLVRSVFFCPLESFIQQQQQPVQCIIHVGVRGQDESGFHFQGLKRKVSHRQPKASLSLITAILGAKIFCIHSHLSA